MWRLPWQRQMLVLRTPLHSNSVYLIGNSAVAGFLGFMFWVVAARLYTAEAVGLGSALTSAALLLSFLARFGLGFGVIRFLPTSGTHSSGLINSSFICAGLAAVVLAATFLAGLPVWSPSLLFVREAPLFVAAFIALVPCGAIFGLLTQVFIAVRRAEHTLILGLGLGVLRLALVIGMGTMFGAFGIFASWGVAVAVTLSIGVLVFLTRLQPDYTPTTGLGSGLSYQILGFSFTNHVSQGLWSLPTWLLPLMVVNLLGGEANAHSFVSWAMAGHLFQIPIASCQSLFSEGSHCESFLARDVTKSLKFIAVLLLPAAAAMLVLGDKFLLVFGREYSVEGGKLLAVLTISALPLTVNVVYLTIARVRQRLNSLIRASAAVAVGTLTLGYLLIPSTGILGPGIAWLVSQSLVAAVVLPSILRLLKSK